MQTVKAAHRRVRQTAYRNTRFYFHGLRPLVRREIAYTLSYRPVSGAVGKVPGYRVPKGV